MAGGEEFNRRSAPVDYEMWLRMAADNKINAKNSWNFALIDYFYDLSFQPVTNFQRASAILDGCIKIYSSRVDSAVTETGTLLSGLSSSRHLKSIVEDIDAESNVVSQQEEPKQYRRRNIRLENTLVSSFEQIRIKNIEKELIVDPIFKKTIANFDEGGAKSLLLNTLVTDNNGRLVLDSDNQHNSYGSNDELISSDSWDTLRSFIETGAPMENLSICESMGALKQLINKTDEIVEQPEDDFNLDYNYGSDNEEYNDYNDMHFDDDDDDNDNNDNKNEEIRTIGLPDYELMDYFDNTMKRNLVTLPTFWKVERFKSKEQRPIRLNDQPKKERNFIDFSSSSIESDTAFEDEIFSTSNAKISIPEVRRKKGISYNNFCLTENYRITTQSLVELFTKKELILNSFTKQVPVEDKPQQEEYSNYLYDEPSRLMGEITREDMNELNKSFVEDSNEPFRPQFNLVKQLNYEKISKRIDIATIKQEMLQRLGANSTFSELVQGLPSDLNATLSVYFICLLHLSNEMGLSLEYNGDNDLLVHTQT